MNNDSENKNESLKKEKEGTVEFRKDDRHNIIKGAKQEDQLDKLHQGEKSSKDDVGSQPVERVPKDKNES